MSTVVDLAGNNPVALDPANTRTDKISSVEFRGATQTITPGAAEIQSAPFGNLTRFIRIAPQDDIFYDIDSIANVNADSTVKRLFLAANAVEAMPVRPGQVIEIVETADAASGIVTITEDK